MNPRVVELFKAIAYGPEGYARVERKRLELGSMLEWADALSDAGYAIVPREPTEEMDEAGLDDPNAAYCDRCMQSGHTRNSGHPSVIWRAMLKAFENA